MSTIVRFLRNAALTALALLTACAPGPSDMSTAADLDEVLTVLSPDGRIRVQLIADSGDLRYRVERDGEEIVAPSRLGFSFGSGPPLGADCETTRTERALIDETWTQPWGEAAEVRNHCNELRVEFTERSHLARRLIVVFRVFDDGLGFRYVFPQQEQLREIVIMEERTEFALAGDWRAWSIPGLGPERYEYLYRSADAKTLGTVHTPLTLERDGGPCIAIHEAALTDYPSMTLIGSADGTLRCHLVPWPGGVKAVATAPFATPWRTIQIADEPGGLITSYLGLNLNEPCEIEDTSWIEPGKYVGIWWGMHLGSYTWGSGPKHGATTANAKRYVDFAAENGFRGVLIEGWNPGWDGDWWGNGADFVFTEAHPDFDIEAVCRYAAERGVRIIGHHETGADVLNYERQLEDAMAYYERLGIDAVKTGYVGRMCDGDQWHHGQYMVRHYRRVVETAARHRIMVDVHEPIKDTGIRRTWPNMMTREGARGQEYNAWSGDGGNPPEHETILPFTRLLAGPFDFTPGIFGLLYPELRPNNRVNTTLAKQLALYVVLYSPMQMAADLPENYENQPAFRFVRDVPCDWAESRVLNGRIGDFVTIVRRERAGDGWYLGSVTDEERRSFDVKLDFLDPGRAYVAQIYADAADADWAVNPLAMQITEREVTSRTRLRIDLAAGGGQAIRIAPR